MLGRIRWEYCGHVDHVDCLERQGLCVWRGNPTWSLANPITVVLADRCFCDVAGLTARHGFKHSILGLRKEQREARAEALDRRRQELEIEKLQLELEREKASASKRINSQPSTPMTFPMQPGSNDVERQVASNQAAKEPPFPLDGERNRLRDKWSELDRKYQELTRLLGAVDKDLGLALDLERRLVLQEHRDELAAQRDEISVSMADLERRLAELGSAG